VVTLKKKKCLSISRLALPCNPEVRSGIATTSEVRSGIATTARGYDLLITSRNPALACPYCMD